MRMRRLSEKTIATLMIAIFLTSVSTVALSFAENDDIYIDEYKATFYPNGTLVEEYTYEIEVKKYRMLFRFWAAPLTVDSLNQPYIELLENEVAPGAIGYYKDYTGQVSVNEPHKDNWTMINTIESLAYSNEVGSYKPDYFDPGRYTVKYTFDIHPPLEYDDENGHLNLMLADEHIRYRSVIIVFENSDYIDALYTHPLSYNVSKEDGRIVVTGSAGENELIEVEMLLDLDSLMAMDGFLTRVEDIRLLTMMANIEFYENLESKFNTLSQNFTKLQEDLYEANLEISSLNERIISLENEASGGIPGFPIQSLALGIILVSVIMGLMRESKYISGM